MKILVLNPKGGAGKSTTAIQLIAPYIYHYTKKKVPYFEFDLHNDDISTFKKSMIIEPHLYQSEKEIPTLLDDLEFSEDAIVDVGGNQSTNILLNNFAWTETLGNFHLVVCPFGDSDLDMTGALEMYQLLKKDWDFNFLSVLCRAQNLDDDVIHDQFFNFFGDTQHLIDGREGFIEKFDESDRSFVTIPVDKSLVMSRAFGKTVYEIGKKSRDQFKTAKEQAQKNHDKEEFIKQNKILRFHEYCGYFTEQVIEPAFSVIDDLMK